jgi:hypothetical protein
MVIQRAWGFVALALWLIAVGMSALLGLNFDGKDQILGIVAIIAGLLILVGK